MEYTIKGINGQPELRVSPPRPAVRLMLLAPNANKTLTNTPRTRTDAVWTLLRLVALEVAGSNPVAHPVEAKAPPEVAAGLLAL